MPARKTRQHDQAGSVEALSVIRMTGIAAANAAKTRCRRGHKLEGSNLAMIKGRGGRLFRRCRACARITDRRRRGVIEPQPRPEDRTHCPADHEYDDASTRIVTSPDGRQHRQCITCHRKAARDSARRRRQREREQRRDAATHRAADASASAA